MLRELTSNNIILRMGFFKFFKGNEGISRRILDLNTSHIITLLGILYYE